MQTKKGMKHWFSQTFQQEFMVSQNLASKYSFEVISNFLMENEYPKKVVLCCYDIENLQKTLFNYYKREFMKTTNIFFN